MTHRIRVFVSMAILLGVVVFGAWLVMLRTTIRPFADRLEGERVSLAVGAAKIVEETPSDERAAVREASRRLGVKVQILDELPSRRTDRAIETRRDGHTVYTWARPNSPTIVTLDLPGRPRYLAMKFADTDEVSSIGKRAAAGLVLIGILSLAGALVATRWVLRPLETADSAMLRVADGDLRHRVPEGGDVTGRMGKTFNQMAERVEAMVEGQKQLLAAVSHELRTPLTRMRLVVEMLGDQGTDPKHVASMERDIDEVDRLVGTLLESTRLERGGWVLEKAPAKLATVVSRAADGLELGGRKLDVEVPDGIELDADASRLGRVFKNLFTNFVRYTPDGATCWVRATKDARGVHVVVEDDGPGVPAVAIDKLFTPFYRVDPSRSRESGGLGLGLMLVRQIVEAHGGTIVVDARPGGGLRFRIESLGLIRARMDDARRFEDVEVDCLRTLHDAASAAGHASRFSRFGNGAAWAVDGEPAIALAAALGLGDDPIREIDLVEGFFESARVPGRFEVASIAHPGLAAELALRGYQPRRVNRLLFAPIASLAPPPLAHAVEDVDPDEWCRVAGEGFPASSPVLFAALARQRDAVRVGVRLDGTLVGVALLTRRGDIALFSATCVLEPWRGRGVHGSLFRARLDVAREWGVSSVAYTCGPGTISERNALRWGLTPIAERTLYSR